MSKVILAVAACAVAAASAAPLSASQTEFLFTRFVAQYNKEYPTNEFFAKYNTFVANLNKVIAHNAKGNSYTMAINEFGDLTFDEFSAKLGLKVVKAPYARSLNTKKTYNRKVTAGKKDWREEGAVNDIKNQGQCGSCWAFSAIAAVESTTFTETGKLLDLSESQLVDCAGDFGNGGCQGGLMDSAFEYLISNGGACATSEYPYKAVDGQCKTDCKPVAQISGFKNVKADDEDDLIEQIKNSGVVSVAVEANSNFQFYSSGVFSGPCGTSLNHGIAAVGYDLDASKPYYIVRNSWGGSWGEGGYIKMATGKNLCGIAAMASYTQ